MRSWGRILTSLGLVFFCLFILWMAKSRGAERPSPLTEVRQTINDLKNAVNDPKLKGQKNEAARRSKIRELILARMDFHEMAKRSLGSHWPKLSESERAEYLKIFPDYMQAAYRKMIFESVEFIDSANISYPKERIDGEFAEVDLVIESSPENTKIVFRLHFVNGRWMAYDAVIAGISQVQNNRSQFSRIIAKNSFAELLKLLRSKS